MASSLASQLAKIAANSKSSLNLKTQKAAHSKSLIFEPRIAASQSFQTVYTLCNDGFQDLCRLDGRFAPYGNTLFSEQSQNEDRTQLTKTENEKLDKIIEAFLRLVGSRLRLMPAIKAVEWLIRRFRIHEFNTASLITTFLPYHSIPAFVTLMSILPSTLPHEYRFLVPYVRSLTAPPRAAIVQQATSRSEFLLSLSTYTLEACRSRQDYPTLVSFWAGIMTEAVNNMLDKMRSGRRSIQAENDHALLQLVTPILGEALVMRDSPSIQIASYMVVAVLASKGNLDDKALSPFMAQLVHGWTSDTRRPGLVCLSILAQYRSAKPLPKEVAKALLKVPDLVENLKAVGHDYRVDKLASGLALALIDRLYKKGDIRGVAVIRPILLSGLLLDKQVRTAYKALLVAAHRIDDTTDEDGQIRRQVGLSLVALSQETGSIGEIIRQTVEEVDFDVEELELKLETTVRPRLALEAPASEDLAVENGGSSETKREETLEAILERISRHTRPPGVQDCFARDSDDLYNELYGIFLTFASDKENLFKFNASPILCQQSATTDAFYLTFYMRIWCGPHPALARTVALQQVKERLKSDDCQKIDFQAILPYAIVALRDPSKRVRRSAAELLAVLGNLYSESQPAKEQRWSSNDETIGKAQVMDTRATHSLVHQIILPALEESIIDENHITVALKDGLDGPKSAQEPAQPYKTALSHTARLAILKALSSHVIYTPFLLVKTRLLDALNQVRSISGTSRTLVLLPLLRWWASLGHNEPSRLAAREGLDVAAVDKSCVGVVAANDKPGLEALFELIDAPQVRKRHELLRSIFSRIEKMWPSMKAEARFSTAQAVLKLSHDTPPPATGQDFVSVEAADLLRNVELTTDILLEFLESCRDSAQQAADSPARKRRRVSSSDHSRSAGSEKNPDMSAVLNKTTFVLELIQGSKPEQHPQLLHSLFTTLSDLQHLRMIVGSELGYLQNLVLSSLLAMMPVYRNNKDLQIDASVGHGDALVTCIQKSSSPAVQNTALLLVAGLANTAPDVVIHSVMPIFTFMGSSVLRQADDYSAHVVNQTIREVVPPLIDTFKKSRRPLVASASELLSSFVVAYEHIPSHRKHELFISLVENLGPSDFLFAVLAMFVDRYGTTDNILGFLVQIMNSFDVEVQLQTLVKLLDLIRDIFKPKPVLSAALLGKNGDSDQDAQKLAAKELSLLPRLLGNRRLKTEIAKFAERDDMEIAKLRDLYASLLEDILTLADTVKTKKSLYTRCGDALSSLLNLLSIGEFIKAVETLLDRPNIALRHKVLRGLELRVDKEGMSPESRTALLAFLPQLTAVIRESDDVPYKHTAIVCVDKIAEKYGKKDIEAVTAAAATIAGARCLGQSADRLRIMALLCLASLVDVLQDAVVPVLPTALPTSLGYLRECLEGGKEVDVELHNASYAFLTSLAQHVPYMISGAYLDELLACSNISAEAGLDQDANDSRLQCLRLSAKVVDAKVLFAGLEKNRGRAADAGFSALAEYYQILGIALDKHPKSAITKNVSSLSAILMGSLDLRQRDRYREAASSGPGLLQLVSIEDTVNEVALKMIYKLNDAVFRPIFAQLVEFAAAKNTPDRAARIARQESVYGFLHAFFGNLKSIVTSYGSYVVDGAAALLDELDPSKAAERELWRRVLRTLGRCFEHDQDGFWQHPAHFGAVAPVLVRQFEHASNSSSTAAAAAAVDVCEELVPAVVELAGAADSQEHHKEINGSLLRLLRSEQAAVRLAVVKCLQALTDRLGEDWLSMLPEMLPFISELQDDDDEVVERETHRWIVKIEGILGESLDSMLQ